MASRLEPKLLRQIFDLLPRSQNARNAAVCRAWSEEALECVWQVVDAGVFGALGKMAVKNVRGKSTWYFVRPPTPSDWTGLINNADRVLEIDIRHGPRSLPLSESAWYEVSHSRTRLTIFPYLEKISGGVKAMNGLFMAETVNRVDLRLDCCAANTSADVAMVRSFITRFEHYMPSVCSLYLRGQRGCKDTFTLFGRLCGSLRLLEDVTAPAELLNPVFFNFLASSASLGTIAMDLDTDAQFALSDDGRAYAADDMALQFQSGCFPVLRRFALGMLSSTNAVRIFSHPHFPMWRLRSICLQFPYGWQLPGIDVEAVIRVVADSCHCLEEFTICFAEWCKSASMIETDDCERVKIRDILPIFRVRSLESFYIQHPHALIFQDGDVEALARAASGIRVLWLNPWPRWNRLHDLLSLDCVSLFALHCPALVRLGISSDCLVRDVGRSATFESLEELFIGDTSFSLEEAQVSERYNHLSSAAVYLSVLMPPCCKLTSMETGSGGIVKPFYKQCHAWKRVTTSQGWRVLLSTVGLLMEEKESVFIEGRRLQSEVQSLEGEIVRLTAGWL